MLHKFELKQIQYAVYTISPHYLPVDTMDRVPLKFGAMCLSASADLPQ